MPAKKAAADESEALLMPILPQTDFPTHVLNKEKMVAFAQEADERVRMQQMMSKIEAAKRSKARSRFGSPKRSALSPLLQSGAGLPSPDRSMSKSWTSTGSKIVPPKLFDTFVHSGLNS